MKDKTLHGLLSSLPIKGNVPLPSITAAQRRYLPEAYGMGLLSFVTDPNAPRGPARQFVALTPEGIRRRRSLTEKIRTADNLREGAQK